MIRASRDYLVILAAHFFFFLNFSQLILLPKYLLALGMPPSRIGIAMGAFSISVVLALPVVAVVSEVIPRRALFMLGAFLMSVPSVFYPEIQGMTAGLFFLRILQGVGFSCAFGVAGAIVSDTHPVSEGSVYLGILAVAGILTQALGPFLGEYLIRTSGFDALFRTAFLFGIISLIIAFFLGTGISGRTSSLKGISLAPLALVSSGILGLVFGCMVIFLPPYLMKVGVKDSSPFFIGFSAGGLVVWTLLHRTLSRLNRSGVWAVMSLLLVLPMCTLGSADSAMALAFFSLLSGIGYGYLYPTLNAEMIAVNPASRGIANALFVWSFNVGMLVASVGFGYLCEYQGYSHAFLIIAVVGLIFLACSGFSPPFFARIKE